MHDPSTVAFDIKSPFRQRPSKMWPNGYRDTWITIWHEDPMDFEGKVGCRSDDSCGWFNPPMTSEIDEAIRKLAKEQYPQICEFQVRSKEGASYAYLCNQPTVHEAVYWSWRAVKQKFAPRGLWQYGSRLTFDEVQAIFDLASCPIDNLKHSFSRVKDEDSFRSFFFLVARAYFRHHRPWYKHPRWHFWHWKFQIHPWQKFRRYWLSRCAGCGGRFAYGESPTTTSWDHDPPGFLQGEKNVYHSRCCPRPDYPKREDKSA